MEIFYRQRDYFKTGKTRTLAHRLEGLAILERVLLSRRKDLFAALRLDLGKSDIDSDLGEVGFILDEIRQARRQLKSWMSLKKVGTPLFLRPGKSYLVPCPLGVVLIMSPWNYPFRLSLGPLVGALAAGNCAILKLSPHAPQSKALITELIAQNFPPGWVDVLVGDDQEVQQLLSCSLNHVFFTGSRKVGSLIAQSCAKKLIPVTLELGGQNPALVHHDADIPVTAKRLAMAKFFNSGQTCVAPNFIFVHRSVLKDFLPALQGALQEWKDHSWGKLINREHWNRLEVLLEGQNVIYGGKGDVERLTWGPTLVLNPSWEDPLMAEEIFGPILPILEYEDEERIMERLSSRSACLAAYLFTPNRSLQERFVQLIPSGGICINDAILQINNPYLPFGGLGESGHGCYNGEYSFRTFSFFRPVMRRPFYLDLPLRYPPFTETKKKLLRWVLGLPNDKN